MTQLERGVHILQDNEFVRYCRREIPAAADRLVSVYCQDTARWSIGVWVNRPEGLMDEITGYGLEGPTRDSFLTVKINLNPQARHHAFVKWWENMKAANRAKLEGYAEGRKTLRGKINTFRRNHVNIHRRDDPGYKLMA